MNFVERISNLREKGILNADEKCKIEVVDGFNENLGLFSRTSKKQFLYFSSFPYGIGHVLKITLKQYKSL